MEPTFDLRLFTTTGTTSELFHSTYGAALDIVLEQGDNASRTIANYKTSGENTLKALSKMLADGRFTNKPDVGSREFNGSTDRIDWSNFYNPTGQPISISAWINSDGNADSNSDYICNIQDSGDSSYGTVFYTRSVTAGQVRQIGFTANGATDVLRLMTAITDFKGAWHHVLVTFDGTFTDATKIHLYFDGSEVASYDSTVNGVTETSHSGSFCIGGRSYDDLRNFDGKIAQLGVHWPGSIRPATKLY